MAGGYIQERSLKGFSRCGKGSAVLAVAWRQRDVLIQDEPCPELLVGAKVRYDLLQQRECLAVRHRIRESRRMLLGRRSLARHFADACGPLGPVNQFPFRTADGDNQLATFSRVPTRQTDRPFAVDQAGEIRGVFTGERARDLVDHGAARGTEKAPGLSAGGADGGGGGTAGLPLPRQAGLCLHPDRVIGGGACYPEPSPRPSPASGRRGMNPES